VLSVLIPHRRLWTHVWRSCLNCAWNGEFALGRLGSWAADRNRVCQSNGKWLQHVVDVCQCVITDRLKPWSHRPTRLNSTQLNWGRALWFTALLDSV